MTDLLTQLLHAQGVYRGRGDGAETGPFLARIEVRAVVGGRGVVIDYEASNDRDGVQHAEHSVLSEDENGRLALHVLCSELPGVTRFSQNQPGTFTAYDGSLQARIVVKIPVVDALSYAWWWSRDGDALHEQSRADVHRTG